MSRHVKHYVGAVSQFQHVRRYRSRCHGNMHLYAAPKSHRPWPALVRAAKSIDTYCTPAGSARECIYVNPIDASAGSSRGEGAHAPIINHAITSLIWHPIYTLCLRICHPVKRWKALASSVTVGEQGL